MASEVLTDVVRAAAVRGAIEILINPEFSTDWILNDVLRDVPDEEVTEAVAEQVDDLIMARFKEFAITLLAELPVENRKGLEHLSE